MAVIIFVIVICPIILCGCWNYREIDTLAIVAGIAIDKDVATNKYLVTTEIITSQTQGGSSLVSSEIYTAEGDSIFSAVRNTINKTGLKLFWSGAKVVIISKSVASDGVIPVIDWTNRSSDVRSDMWVLISKGNSAAEILKTKSKLNLITSYHIDDAMQSGRTLSKFTDSRLWSFIDGMSSEGKAEAVATVENAVYNGTIEPSISGTAIFKQDKLIGYIDENETEYMLMIQNKMKEGLINLKDVSGSGTGITLEIDSNKTKLTPIYNNGTASMIIDIYPVVTIQEVEGTKDFMKEDNLLILQSEAQKRIKFQVQHLITKLQKDYNSDVLGFGETFEEQNPKVAQSYKKNGEDIFENINTVVNVHLKIRGSGRTTNSIPLEK